MRVVAGSARGRRLQAPPGRAVRPTSDRVREAVFDMLTSMGVVEGASVADLFAGTGALGVEALSRGASSAVFVDHDGGALASVKANLAATGLGTRATVVHAPVLTWLDTARPVDLAFADPPYAFDDWPGLLGPLRAGLVVAESDRQVDAGEGWKVLRARRYGGTVVTMAEMVSDRPW